MRIFNLYNHKQKTRTAVPFRIGMFALVLGMSLSFASCDKYLDVVPDNVVTIDHAFTLANEAERYLFTCYSFIPKNGDGWYNAGMMAGDEIWLPGSPTYVNSAFSIAEGRQNSNAPLLDGWTGERNGALGGSGKRMFSGIRTCNIFLENITDLAKVPDLDIDKRTRWIGEAEFLKAYYHFYLLRMYGPVPIIDENAPIDADVTSNYVSRQPVDSCVNYISRLLDSAIGKLPNEVQVQSEEMGRATKPMALALKAKLWIMAASPLFNGNPDYANFVDNDGVELFPSAYDAEKWVKAKEACKAAIEAAEGVGHELHYYNGNKDLNYITETQTGIREAVSEPWNSEIVWGNTNSYFEWYNQNLCQIVLTGDIGNNRLTVPGAWEVPIKIAKMFYTANGVPIDEDKTLDFSNYEELRVGTTDERFNIKEGYTTARLNFDRENRFYADLGFDGGIWYKNNSTDSGNPENRFYAQTKWNDPGGIPSNAAWNETGYYPKKLVNLDFQFVDATNTSYKAYPWPEIRLADLYLLYAEALNEVEPASTEAIVYLDKIRERAGLAGVADSWTNYSTDPGKYTTQDGLREIIHQERMIELAFEGHRFWDLRRWKKAADELNKDITGWNYTGTTSAAYYHETHIFSQTFVTPRDYFWPIGTNNTRQNLRLVENPGW